MRGGGALIEMFGMYLNHMVKIERLCQRYIKACDEVVGDANAHNALFIKWGDILAKRVEILQIAGKILEKKISGQTKFDIQQRLHFLEETLKDGRAQNLI